PFLLRPQREADRIRDERRSDEIALAAGRLARAVPEPFVGERERGRRAEPAPGCLRGNVAQATPRARRELLPAEPTKTLEVGALAGRIEPGRGYVVRER